MEGKIANNNYWPGPNQQRARMEGEMEEEKALKPLAQQSTTGYQSDHISSNGPPTGESDGQLLVVGPVSPSLERLGDEELIRVLGSLCKDPVCPHLQCEQKSDILQLLHDNLHLTSRHFSGIWLPFLDRIMALIFKHATVCSDLELHCKVPLCAILNARFPGTSLMKTEKVHWLQWRYGFGEVRLFNPLSENNITVYKGGRIGTQEREDWFAVGSKEKFGDVFVCQTLRGRSQERFQIQQHARVDQEVMKRALSRDGPIVPHHWCQENAGLFYVAKDCFGSPLTGDIVKIIRFESAVLQLCDISQFLRSLGIRLLDWEERNFCVDAAGRILLDDLSSCVLIADQDEADLQAAAYSVTPWIVSPELWMGYSSEYTNTWSIGVLLYKLYTGNHPADIHQTPNQIRNQSKQGAHQFNFNDFAETDREIRRVLRWMTHERPLNRPTPSDIIARYTRQ